ncbi:MAG: flavodoxin family protein [Desulfohalobiaceae bacterium]
MADLVAVYGSPRRKGNTSTLLAKAVEGARQQGLSVQEFFLRDQKISPCLELYHCMQNGECSIKDDFQGLRDQILQARGLILASPIFFYSVTAQTKAFMDRFQSLWVKKYLLEQTEFGIWEVKRLGLFISAGATRGKKLFEGTLLSVKYFCDVLDMQLWDTLLYRGLDGEQDILAHPEYMQQAQAKGVELARALQERSL